METGRQKLGVPGVAVGIVQDGKVVFADGFGVRRLGSPEKPDGDTLFMVASNTKALTTLLLAKLLDEGKLNWETPVTKLLPSFQLGDPRHDPARPREASHLRLHGPAPTGLRMALRIWRADLRGGDEDARGHEAHE